MAGQPRILIVGASGVFGRLLARELLASTDADLVLAARDRRALSRLTGGLAAGDRAEPLVLDLRNPLELQRAAAGCAAVACTAGPFQHLPFEAPHWAVAAGASWLDIADDSTWVQRLLADSHLHEIARGKGLIVMPGASTVPAVSGALVRWCCQRLPAAQYARITLFIGNRNGKGASAIASALRAGFDAPRLVTLPVGRRPAYCFASPDTALLRAELGIEAEFRVAFEWTPVSRLLAALNPLARGLSARAQARVARLLALGAAPLSRCGSDTGCLQAEVWDDGGRAVRTALISSGQRLVVLPCALALRALLSGELRDRGVVHPATWLKPDEWVQRLQAHGIRFVASVRPAGGRL